MKIPNIDLSGGGITVSLARIVSEDSQRNENVTVAGDKSSKDS